MEKTIIITGATRGLGLAMALRFAAMGHTVHACGRKSALVAALAAKLPPTSTASAVDIADDAAVAEWAGNVLGQGTAPDLLVNNAAAIPRRARAGAGRSLAPPPLGSRWLSRPQAPQSRGRRRGHLRPLAAAMLTLALGPAGQ